MSRKAQKNAVPSGTAFLRGRNAHAGHIPKNKSVAEYHSATALEAVFGWLYATGQTGRTNALFNEILKLQKETQNEENR